jgi:hypothetical protein
VLDRSCERYHNPAHFKSWRLLAAPSGTSLPTLGHMAYRSAAAMRLAVLLSGMLPVAALAQSPRAPSAVADSASPEPGEGSGAKSGYRPATNPLRAAASPVVRFAATADDEIQPPGSTLRASGKSVLAPPGEEWLKQNPKASDLPPSSLSDLPPDPLSDGPLSGRSSDPLADDLSPQLAPVVGGPLMLAPPEPLTVDGISPGGSGPVLTRPPEPGDLPLGVPALGSDATFIEEPRGLPSRRQPMMRESWLYRPFNVSIFDGALFAAPPIQPQFNTTVAYFTGLRIGWDFSRYFGGEERFGFSKVFLLDGASHSVQVGYQRLFYFDANLLIYPWGDTRIRPYVSIGSGYADVFIVSNAGLRLHPGAFNLPMGVGVKYRHSSRLAFRADFRDNLTFSGGGGLRTLNNLEFVGGVEFHFGGGNRRNYWPWNPSHHWW